MRALSGADRATLVLFDDDAIVASEPMATADRVSAAIGAAKLGDEGTKYAPALKLASQIISASTLPQREVVVVSDFQKTRGRTTTRSSFRAARASRR